MSLVTKYGKDGIGRYAYGVSGQKKPKAKRRKFARAKPAFKEQPLYRKGMGSEFYQTREWQKLRFNFARSLDGKCQMCGRSMVHGIIIHVDHIVPRSKCPDRELDITNLQLLCEDCNMGKGATTWSRKR